MCQSHVTRNCCKRNLSVRNAMTHSHVALGYSVWYILMENKCSGVFLTLEETWPSFNSRRACSLKTSTRATHSSHKWAASSVPSFSLLVVKDLGFPEAPEAPEPSGESRSARGTQAALNWPWEGDLLLVICASWRQSHARPDTSSSRQPSYTATCLCMPRCSYAILNSNNNKKKPYETPPVVGVYLNQIHALALRSVILTYLCFRAISEDPIVHKESGYKVSFRNL